RPGSSNGVPRPLRFSNGGRPRPIVSPAPHGGVTPESTREPNAGINTVDTESSALWNPPPDGISALPALAGCTAHVGEPPVDLTGAYRSAQRRLPNQTALGPWSVAAGAGGCRAAGFGAAPRRPLFGCRKQPFLDTIRIANLSYGHSPSPPPTRSVA